MARWLVILVTLSAIADVLQWAALTNFLRSVVAYTPNVLVALAMIFVGLVLANVLRNMVQSATQATGLPEPTSNLLASITQTAVIVFAFMAALTQLNIARELLVILFAGIVFALSLGFGLAFGLGGREKASSWLDQLGGAMSPGRGGASSRATARRG